ncbi:hypothetical protein Hanom_Chr17g01551161 [Helianthus anomalus]
MGDNSDDEVLEVSRDQFVHKLDKEQNAITINEGLGEPSKGKQLDVDCTSKGFIAEGSPSLTKDRLLVLVSNRAGFTKKLHTLKFENLQGQVSIYEVKPEKMEVHYAIQS